MYMNKVQDKYQKFGAGDSEPERTIDDDRPKLFQMILIVENIVSIFVERMLRLLMVL